MLRKIQKFIFIMKNSGLTKEEAIEFDRFRIKTNINRINKPMVAVFVFSVLQIIIDIVYTLSKKTVMNELSNIFLLHIFMIFFCFLWIIFYRFRNKNNIFKKLDKVYYLFYIVSIVICANNSINNLSVSGQISPYIIASFVFAWGLLIPPKIGTPSLIIMAIGFLIRVRFETLSLEAWIGIVISVLITLIFTIIISITSYISFFKRYINNKVLIEANKKLEALEKDRIEFFANISHELRTPINIIYTANQMINVTNKNNSCPSRALSKYSNMIQQNCNRLIRLVENVIDITRIDALSFEVRLINADIIKILEEIYISIRDYVEKKGLKIYFNTEINEKVIACDPYNIERIILNILSNAIKFTKPDGEIIMNITCDDSFLYISVADTGIGIPEKMIDRIFERFVQVDKSTMRQNEGSGIGLSLVKGLVELHKGTVTVNSRLGEGSEFIIKLPNRLTDKENNISQLGFISNSTEKVSIQFSDIY